MMKTLVIYYSAQWHTKAIAEKIAETLAADIFEIKPLVDYTEADLDWTDGNSRVYREHKDASLQNIELATTEIPNWDEYERVIIAYPIWWGIAAWPVSSFVSAIDWNNKVVFPVATSHSSPLGNSDALLAEFAKGAGDWQNGVRFQQDADGNEVAEWAKGL